MRRRNTTVRGALLAASAHVRHVKRQNRHLPHRHRVMPHSKPARSLLPTSRPTDAAGDGPPPRSEPACAKVPVAARRSAENIGGATFPMHACAHLCPRFVRSSERSSIMLSILATDALRLTDSELAIHTRGSIEAGLQRARHHALQLSVRNSTGLRRHDGRLGRLHSADLVVGSATPCGRSRRAHRRFRRLHGRCRRVAPPP